MDGTRTPTVCVAVEAGCEGRFVPTNIARLLEFEGERSGADGGPLVSLPGIERHSQFIVTRKTETTRRRAPRKAHPSIAGTKRDEDLGGLWVS